MHREELINSITEPLSLADAKAAARVEHGNDDAYIAELITAARKLSEAFTLRRLVPHKFELTYDRENPVEFGVPEKPLASAPRSDAASNVPLSKPTRLIDLVAPSASVGSKYKLYIPQVHQLVASGWF